MTYKGNYIWLQAAAEPSGDSEEFVPGWYYADEAEGLNGPFPTQQAAEKALADYCKYDL